MKSMKNLDLYLIVSVWIFKSSGYTKIHLQAEYGNGSYECKLSPFSQVILEKQQFPIINSSNNSPSVVNVCTVLDQNSVVEANEARFVAVQFSPTIQHHNYRVFSLHHMSLMRPFHVIIKKGILVDNSRMCCSSSVDCHRFSCRFKVRSCVMITFIRVGQLAAVS